MPNFASNSYPMRPLPYGATLPGQAPPAPPPTGVGSKSPLPGYNINPTPTGGQGPYGLVPGTIDIPPSQWQQIIGAAPGLGKTDQLTSNIMSELHGDINPQALKNMQDAAASYGVSSGMPGSNAQPGTLAFNKNLRNIGLDTLQVQRQGQQDYLSALQGIGGTQTPQGLAAEIAAHNAQMKAAPDPQAAAQQQLANYWAALNALRGPGAGTGQGVGPQGGTGDYAPHPAIPQGGSPQQFGRPAGGGLPNYNSNFQVGIQGAGLGWAGDAPTDLWGDLGAGPPQDPSSSYYPGTDVAGMPNLDSILGAPGGSPMYDQTAQGNVDPAMTDEDYFYQMMGGG